MTSQCVTCFYMVLHSQTDTQCSPSSSATMIVVIFRATIAFPVRSVKMTPILCSLPAMTLLSWRVMVTQLWLTLGGNVRVWLVQT